MNIEIISIYKPQKNFIMVNLLWKNSEFKVFVSIFTNFNKKTIFTSTKHELLSFRPGTNQSEYIEKTNIKTFWRCNCEYELNVEPKRP